MASIRDGRLYRDPENPKRTFADYCRERWDVRIQYADRLMNSHRIIEHLQTTPIGVLPATESQCRPLTKLRTENGDGAKVIDLANDD